jgi:hypothetical protein
MLDFLTMPNMRQNLWEINYEHDERRRLTLARRSKDDKAGI